MKQWAILNMYTLGFFLFFFKLVFLKKKLDIGYSNDSCRLPEEHQIIGREWEQVALHRIKIKRGCCCIALSHGYI